LHFSRKQQDEFAPNFFSGFRRKHLFIKTCIVKHCSRPLKAAILIDHDLLYWGTSAPNRKNWPLSLVHKMSALANPLVQGRR